MAASEVPGRDARPGALPGDQRGGGQVQRHRGPAVPDPAEDLERLEEGEGDLSEVRSISHTGRGSARSQDMPYVFSLCSERSFRRRLERALDLDETFDKFLQKEADAVKILIGGWFTLPRLGPDVVRSADEAGRGLRQGARLQARRGHRP